jgi:hypothetical protein
MNPPSSRVAGSGLGLPYLYTGLDLMAGGKYVSLFFSLLWEYSRLEYPAAAINENWEWTEEDVGAENNSVKFEVSLLFALGKTGLNLEAGYGRAIDKNTGGSNYVLIGAKKLWL